VGRDLRVFETGWPYHLTPKGNDGRDLFVDDEEHAEFLARASACFRKHEIAILAHCQMRNHAHFLAIVLGAGEGLSAAMQVLQGGYARWWNQRHGRRGHLFEGRFHSEAVLTDRHLLAAARYIDLNPITADLEKRPEDYRWSSYRAHVGLEDSPALLDNRRFLAFVGSTPRRARERYETFVRDRLPGAAWPPLRP
jgi:REP element-mobilizing transposase RayT